MSARRADGAYVTTTVRLPVELHAAARASADSVYQSLNQFVVQAVAQRVRNWRDPVSGKRVVRQKVESVLDGWVCLHGVHGTPTPAGECEHQAIGAHRASWVSDDHPEGFDAWVQSEGLDVPWAQADDESQEEGGRKKGSRKKGRRKGGKTG